MLGVKAQTLYAYVSRGMVRVAPLPASQGRMYLRRDVEDLAAKGRSAAAATSSAERSLRWGGAPIMHTALTTITPEGPRYRDFPAIELARSGATFERCADLLLQGTLPSEVRSWPAPTMPRALASHIVSLCAGARQSQVSSLLALVASVYLTAGSSPRISAPDGEEMEAKALIQVMAAAFGLLRRRPHFLPPAPGNTVAATIARSSGLAARPDQIATLDACLVVAADHELTPSTFVARIAASVGADAVSCILSALASFEGQQNLAGCDACEQQLLQAGSREVYLNGIKQALAEHRPIPGFNHFAYPEGDPRGVYLLDLARQAAQRRRTQPWFLDALAASCDQLPVRPGIVAGLVAVAASLGMPRGAPGMLMALGRTAGWMAHASEQRLSGVMVRPRTRFVGRAPMPPG